MDTQNPNKIINLRARYREKNYLEEIGENLYRLHCQYDYCRVGYDPKTPNNYEFIDPSGGPFMSLGDDWIIPGKVLDLIFFEKDTPGYLLKFKNKENYDDKGSI